MSTLGQAEATGMHLCKAEVIKSSFADSSHGKQKGSSRLRCRENLDPQARPELCRPSTSDEAKTARRPEMTACPAFGLSTELPVSSNEETETQKGSGLHTACPWPLGQNLGLWTYRRRGGRMQVQEQRWGGELHARPFTKLSQSAPITML